MIHLSASSSHEQWQAAWQEVLKGKSLKIEPVESLEEMQIVASQIASCLPHKCLVLLSGDLGAGKTSFVQLCVETISHLRAAGSNELISEDVTSPSFSLHNHYAAGIDHWDLYRLEDADDLESSGFWDQFAQADGIVFIEWPEKLKESELPRSWPRVKISIQKRMGAGHESRQLELTTSGSLKSSK